jgi:repressor LexA
VFAIEEETVEGLTRRQEQVLEFIRESVRLNGYPPTVREICVGLDLSSPSTVHVHLANLERLGFLRRDPTKPRALDLTQELRPPRPLPLVGRVAAGQPILAEDNVEDYVDVPAFLRRDDGDFVLRVRGDSMIGAGIHSGDYIVVHPQQQVANGEISVVRVDGEEATTKRFYQDGRTVRLESENELYEPIIVNAGQVDLVGKVVGVLRQL